MAPKRASKRSLLQAAAHRGVVPRVEEKLCLGDRAVPLEEHTAYTLVDRGDKKSKWLLLCGREKHLGFLEEQLGLPTRSLWYVPGPLKNVLPKQTSQPSSHDLPVPLQAQPDEDLEEQLDEDLEAHQDDHLESLPPVGGTHVIVDIIHVVGALLVDTRWGRRLATDKNIAVSKDTCFDVIVRKKILTAYVPRWPQVYIECSKEILEWLVQELMLDVQNGIQFVVENIKDKPTCAKGSSISGVLADIVKRLEMSTPQQYKVMWCASRQSFGVQHKETGHTNFIRVKNHEKYKKMGQEHLDQKLLESEPTVKKYLDALPRLEPLVQSLDGGNLAEQDVPVEPSMHLPAGSDSDESLEEVGV